jgi:hypothetical protein
MSPNPQLRSSPRKRGLSLVQSGETFTAGAPGQMGIPENRWVSAFAGMSGVA